RIHGGVPESWTTLHAQPGELAKTDTKRSPPAAGIFQPRPNSSATGVYEYRHPMAVTATATSLDGPLGPPLFRDRTRTKYAPGLTPLAVNEVDVLPVFRLAMFDSPGAEPASMT